MTPSASLQALLELVESDRAARCAEILAAAQAQAASRLEAARQAARRRLRDAVRLERQRARAQVSAARARLEAARRRSAQHAASLTLAQAQAQLPVALLLIWSQPETRRHWLTNVLRHAGERLPRGGWTVRHPALPATDLAWLRCSLGELGVDPVAWEEARGMDAGIEIQAAGARLDATATGLLSDRADVCGRLLALLGEQP